MSAKEARKIRKRYNQAADIYWTQDMERILRRTRAELMAWRIAGPLCIIGGLFLLVLYQVAP